MREFGWQLKPKSKLGANAIRLYLGTMPTRTSGPSRLSSVKYMGRTQRQGIPGPLANVSPTAEPIPTRPMIPGIHDYALMACHVSAMGEAAGLNRDLQFPENRALKKRGRQRAGVAAGR